MQQVNRPDPLGLLLSFKLLSLIPQGIEYLKDLANPSIASCILGLQKTLCHLLKSATLNANALLNNRCHVMLFLE